MEKIKEAFQKVRLDIDFLYQEVQDIKRTIDTLKNQIQHINAFQQTLNRHSTPIPAHQHTLKALKDSNLPISTGNEGVPADRQTDQQTDNNPPISHGNFTQNSQNLTKIYEENMKNSQKIDKIANLEHISTLLSSLDELKKEVRFKFKKLTAQEMLIFSKIYELEEQGLIVDYSILAEKLNLTESSIRDYIQRLIKKGIPVDKIKENNKKIILSISKELKKIASLETIHQLRAI